MDSTHRSIVYYDGACNLCNNTVKWVLKHERAPVLYFATLQKLREHNVNNTPTSLLEANSVVLWHEGKYYTQSEAVMQIALLMGGPYRLARLGYLVPAFLRNALYQLIARNRHQWFGTTTSCLLPSHAHKGRFL